MSAALNKVNDILSRITYKPGWKITARLDPIDVIRRIFKYEPRVNVLVSFMTTDIQTGNQTAISRMSSLDGDRVLSMSEDDIVRFFFKQAILELEQHEFQEWFKYKGVCVFDPHPELKRDRA